MNLGTDLPRKKQEALQEIGIKSENREYSKEELKSFSNIIGEHIYSQSSKNGDMKKAFEMDIQKSFGKTIMLWEK